MAERLKGIIGSVFESWRGPDRRQVEMAEDDASPEPEASDRRDDTDRRKSKVGMPHGILFNTAARLDAIETWLAANCEDEWSMSLVGLDDDLSLKEVRIMFASADDKARFRERFSG